MDRQIFEYDPVVGHRFVAGIKARVTDATGSYLVRTNQAGFRCRHEFTPGRRPGTRRVLLFGDSFTAGDGLADRDRYGDRLEALVPDVEVLNLGLPGSGTDQQYLLHREVAPGLEHDLVVVGVFVENIRRVTARYRAFATSDGERVVLAKPYFTLDGGRLRLAHVPVPKGPVPPDQQADLADQLDDGGGSSTARRLVERLGVKDQVQRLTRHQPFPAYDRPDTEGWLLLRAILEQWIDEARAPVVLSLIPFYRHIEETTSPAGYRDRFAELHRPPAVVVHDPLADFLAHPPGERRRFRFDHDPHMSAAGHDVLARSLAPCVSRALAGTP